MQGTAPSSKAANCTQTSSERGSFAYIKAWPEGSPSCSVHTADRRIPLRERRLRRPSWCWPSPCAHQGAPFCFLQAQPLRSPPCCLTPVTRCCVCALPLSPYRSFLYYFFFYWREGGWFLFQQVPYLCFSSALLQPVGAIFVFYLCCASENMYPGRELRQASGSLILVAVAPETPLGHLALDARGAGGPLGPMGL